MDALLRLKTIPSSQIWQVSVQFPLPSTKIDRKEPYQCIKNRKTIRLLYSSFIKWTVTCFVPVSFAFHDDDTVTWNNNLYGVNYAKGVRFNWIKNAILIIRFNASCMYDCVVYLEQRHVSRAMHSIKYYIEIISNPLGENST